MSTILLATGNQKKGKELQELCANRFTVKTLTDVGLDAVDVVEDAPDFAGNAWKKAREIAGHVKAKSIAGIDWVIADDSGLIVDALDGRPGVRSARYAQDAGFVPPGPSAGFSADDANNLLLLQELAAVDDPRRGARFFCCVVALELASGIEHQAIGTVKGRIARDPRGAGGFGYDPLFVIDDGDVTGRAVSGKRMAELGSAEKHAISHRGRAMRELLKHL